RPDRAPRARWSTTVLGCAFGRRPMPPLRSSSEPCNSSLAVRVRDRVVATGQSPALALSAPDSSRRHGRDRIGMVKLDRLINVLGGYGAHVLGSAAVRDVELHSVVMHDPT